MRLLLSAYSCCPNHGSEPGVGWNTVEQAAIDPQNEVHVLVAAGWEERVRRIFDAAQHPNIHFHFVGVPGLDHLMVEGRGTPGVGLIYYHLWQWFSFRVAQRLHDEQRFDLAHHATFVKYNTPSLLPLLGIPFIWGPVGGAEHAPSIFYREFGWRIRLAEAVRRLLQKVAPLSLLLRWTAQNATLAVGVTKETVAALKQIGAANPRLMPAVALSDNDVAALSHTKTAAGDSPQLIYVGRLIAWKGVHLALRALALCDAKQLTLRVVGDGPLRERLEQEAKTLGIASRVEFLGDRPRGEVLEACRNADGFLYPSLHDSGGNAVIEAMAASLPVIHLAYGGPDLLVPEDAGWKVNATTPEAAVHGLTSALNEFAFQQAERIRRGKNARDHVLANHTWKAQGEKLRALYAQLTQSASHPASGAVPRT